MLCIIDSVCVCVCELVQFNEQRFSKKKCALTKLRTQNVYSFSSLHTLSKKKQYYLHRKRDLNASFTKHRWMLLVDRWVRDLIEPALGRLERCCQSQHLLTPTMCLCSMHLLLDSNLTMTQHFQHCYQSIQRPYYLRLPLPMW